MRDELLRWLGDDARIVAALSDQELAELRAVLTAARKGQAAALAAATKEALRQMPAVFRGGVTEIVER